MISIFKNGEIHTIREDTCGGLMYMNEEYFSKTFSTLTHFKWICFSGIVIYTGA